MYYLVFLTLSIALLSSCARNPIKSKSESLRIYSQKIEYKDDLGIKSLKTALIKQIKYFKGKSNKLMHFGTKSIYSKTYIESLRLLNKNIDSEDPKSFYSFLENNFDKYQVYGDKNWGDVFITSYFIPIIKGSRKRTKKYYYPLYAEPKDMIKVNFSKFENRFDKVNITKEKLKDSDYVLKGRLVKHSDGRRSVVPYYTREEIHNKKGKLKGVKVLAWVDPIDGFFLQIQGSGVVKFKRGSVRVGYAAQNGYGYVAIGKYLTHVISLKEMTMQKIETHLRGLSKKKLMKILNKDTSYVFFRKLKKEPITLLGTEVVTGRTIATDTRYFPKGALGFLNFDRPIVHKDGLVEWVKSSRFVLDHDTGGAIKGPGRIDLFWGYGADAKKHAGIMKNRGHLVYLIPNDKLINQIEEKSVITKRN